MAITRRRAAVALIPVLTFSLIACSGESDTTTDPDATAGQDDGSGQSPSPSAPPSAAPTGPATGEPSETDPEGSDPEGTEPDETESPQTSPARIVIGAAGDILPHNRVVQNAAANAGGDGYDFGPMFADVAELISETDLALCHLETPLSVDNTNLAVPGTLVFNSPREVATGLAEAGFDGCDFASNHTMDRGISGIAETEQVLADAGLGYAGPASQAEGAGEPAWYEVDGIRVAHLAYTYTLPNDWGPNTHVPADAPWLERNLWPAIGVEGITEDADEARAAGADFVVASMHWGGEYIAEPTTDQREIATALLESASVDLILGTHVHVVQPCERINDRYVLYGLGNFLSNQSPDTTNGALLPETQEGMVAQVTLSRDADGTVTSSLAVQPTRVQIDNHVIRLATPEQHATTYERTLSTLRSLGEGSCDVTPLS